MKKQNLFRALAMIPLFGLSYMGFSVSTASERIAGEQVNTTLFSLGTKAQAACENMQDPTSVYLCTPWDARCHGEIADPLGYPNALRCSTPDISL